MTRRMLVQSEYQRGPNVCGIRAADQRDSEAICSYCGQRTYGDHRLISMAHTVSVACGSCTDHWDEEYRREVGEA